MADETTAEEQQIETAALADESVSPTAEKQPAEKQPQPVNKHGAWEAEQRMNKLLREIASRGARIDLNGIDVNNLRPRAEAYAACRILIEKGICTEAELQHEVYTAIAQMLGVILQAVEEQQLTARAHQQAAQGQNGRGKRGAGGIWLPKD